MIKYMCVPLLSLFAGIVGSSAFADETCQGELRRDHNMGVEHFVTTSRVYAQGGVQVYETCV
jgi:hypothetical protein